MCSLRHPEQGWKAAHGLTQRKLCNVGVVLHRELHVAVPHEFLNYPWRGPIVHQEHLKRHPQSMEVGVPALGISRFDVSRLQIGTKNVHPWHELGENPQTWRDVQWTDRPEFIASSVSIGDGAGL